MDVNQASPLRERELVPKSAAGRTDACEVPTAAVAVAVVVVECCSRGQGCGDDNWVTVKSPGEVVFT